MKNLQIILSLAAGSILLSACSGGASTSAGSSGTGSTSQGTERVIYSFPATTLISAGDGPDGSLTLASDGNFYGTTLVGGNFTSGSIFKVTPAGVGTTLYSFGTASNDGQTPFAGLTQAIDGDLYGVTYKGGAGNKGILFKVSLSGIESILYSFGSSSAGNGTSPCSNVIQDSVGNFYGVTCGGGTNNTGTIFKVTSAGIESVLYSFDSAATANSVSGNLIMGSDGNIYGVSSGGGTYNDGTFYQVTTAGVMTVLHSFGGSGDGSIPFSKLIQGSGGSFYGITQASANNANGGTVFAITPAGAETVVASFSSSSIVFSPYSGVIQKSDGNFYGTTNSTLFETTPAGSITTLYDFTNTGDAASIVLGTNGTIYGVTVSGGANNNGAIFSFN